MTMKTYALIASLLAISVSPLSAEVIRSVDKDGNVTFSDAPVPGSVESNRVVIDAPPAPTPQEASESERQAQEMIQRANRNQAERDVQADDRGARIKAAQMDLDSATAHLREVQVVRAGDRQSLANGGSRLRPEYLERVQDAEQQVMDAQKKLNEAKLSR
jgi:type IV secretory pathway VirB10-like protein